MNGSASIPSKYGFAVNSNILTVKSPINEVKLTLTPSGYIDTPNGIINLFNRINIHKAVTVALYGRKYEFKNKRHRVIAYKTTGKSIAKRLKAGLDDLFNILSPQVQQVLLQTFRFFGPKNCPRIPTKVFEDKYYLIDISKYLCSLYAINDNRFYSDNLPYGKWLNGLAPEGKIYPALAKTIYPINYSLPRHLFGRLSELRLPRVFTNRTELLFYLSAAGHDRFRSVEHILANASVGELRKAKQIYLDHHNHNILPGGTQWKCSFRRYVVINELVTWLCDCPGVYPQGTNVVTLAKRSDHYHRELGNRRHAATVAEKGVNTALSAPQTIPNLPGITLFTESDQLFAETELMSHCVKNYVRKAVEGRSYLFHVEYEGEHATAEVSDGQLVQIKGPKNQQNKACVYGAKALKDWAKTLPRKESGHGSSSLIEQLGEFIF